MSADDEVTPQVTVERAEYVFTGYLQVHPKSGGNPMMTVAAEDSQCQPTPMSGYAYRITSKSVTSHES